MNRWLTQFLICLIALSMVFTIGFAQKVRTIPQLQIVSLDSLKKLDTLQNATGGKSLQASPYWGGADANADTVTVTGVVMVKPGVLTYTLARYNIYVQDTTTGQLWGGLNVLTNDTSTSAQASGITALDTGMVVTITGRILEFGSQNNSLTEMYHYSASTPAYTSPPPISIGTIINRPSAKEIPLSALSSGTFPRPSTAEPYEGMYVVVRNVTVISVDYSSGRFTYQDSLGNVGYIYDGSGWYTLRGHKFSSSRYAPPPVGTKLSYIRGIILPQSRSGTCGDYTIMPLYPGPREQTNSKYPGDIGIASFSPQITSIARTPSPPKRSDVVTVTWKAKNLNTGGKIDSSYFNWRVGSSPSTKWVKAKAAATGGDSLYTATIPAANADTLISYFVEAWGGGVYGSAPDSSKPLFYQIRQSGLTIRDIQFTPFVGGIPGLIGDTVTVSGVITADTTDIKQNLSGRPTVWMASAAGAWNGIAMYSANAGVVPDTLVRGDSVQVTGVVTERGVSSNDSRTSLLVQSFTLVKRGVPVPAATSIGISGSGSVSYQDANRPLKGASPFEQWESVLVKLPTCYVTMLNADNAATSGSSNFGEFFISSTRGASTTAFGLRINDDGTNNYFCDTTVAYQTAWRSAHPLSPPKNKLIPINAAIASLTGIMTYSNGEYKLEPRKNDDWGVITAVTYRVENVVPTSFELSQNYPNPFNPSTTIRYMLPVGGKVTLKVYNLLGQVVETLVEQQQNAGAYVIVFNASRLSSGTYFYKLETDQYSVTKKMMLLK